MINWSRVSELKNDIGAENIDEVVELFLEEVEGVLGELKKHPDLAQVKCATHFLKGSALNLGFAHLGALCGEGELLDRQPARTATLVADILAAYDTSKAEFMDGLRRH